MAPIKFDKHVKEKLEKRTIKPSSDAWDRLSQRLDAVDKDEKKASYWWLGVAASVIGIVFIVTPFFKDTSKGEGNDVVKNPNHIEEVKLTQEPKTLEAEVKEVVTLKEQVDTKALEIVDTIKEVDIRKSSITIVTNNVTAEKQQDITPTNEVENVSLTFEEQKIQEVVAQVRNLKEKNNNVSDAEIDALLKRAQQEIAFKKLYDQNTGIVDANALLQDVEEELDKSFRTKVFEALKKSYGTVKTAVAQRND